MFKHKFDVVQNIHKSQSVSPKISAEYGLLGKIGIFITLYFLDKQ